MICRQYIDVFLGFVLDETLEQEPLYELLPCLEIGHPYVICRQYIDVLLGFASDKSLEEEPLYELLPCSEIPM